MILFVFTVMFIIDRSISIRDRKIFADSEGDFGSTNNSNEVIVEWLNFEIDCKQKVLNWIIVAFVQYYGFMILVLILKNLNLTH